MIEYINAGAPFTAFSLTKKRPQDGSYNPMSSTLTAKLRSKTRQGFTYAGDQKNANTGRKLPDQRRSNSTIGGKNPSLAVQGKHTSMFDDQFARDKKGRSDIRPLIKGAFARKFGS